MKKLPKTIYVRWEDDGQGGQFLTCSEEWETHAELGQKLTVGTYQLAETDYVISETKKVPTRR